ncbi:hypothetical protein SAMD00019534_118600 [Acytostelium subglobosum LB1]|uniref:hypothetical protein n=1 Tax=Acytostelium subglobosum LB1 TaxID=1410327 RepID=UPI0006449708|nr:hypothetical protein SAMD00019534_118600 [Acytostelium subglobosum LB1]GAM28684.1 hypothetical protein SAMD00019534_118600 [Acytostelium subglobosum LB1]|eukprot:XP_012748462.1 hypothetical protein SAMD00019534_118600 [Acytostelium subglobosum LB1]
MGKHTIGNDRGLFLELACQEETLVTNLNRLERDLISRLPLCFKRDEMLGPNVEFTSVLPCTHEQYQDQTIAFILELSDYIDHDLDTSVISKSLFIHQAMILIEKVQSSLRIMMSNVINIFGSGSLNKLQMKDQKQQSINALMFWFRFNTSLIHLMASINHHHCTNIQQNDDDQTSLLVNSVSYNYIKYLITFITSNAHTNQQLLTETKPFVDQLGRVFERYHSQTTPSSSSSFWTLFDKVFQKVHSRGKQLDEYQSHYIKCLDIVVQCQSTTTTCYHWIGVFNLVTNYYNHLCDVVDKKMLMERITNGRQHILRLFQLIHSLSTRWSLPSLETYEQDNVIEMFNYMFDMVYDVSFASNNRDINLDQYFERYVNNADDCESTSSSGGGREDNHIQSDDLIILWTLILNTHLNRQVSELWTMKSTLIASNLRKSMKDNITVVRLQTKHTYAQDELMNKPLPKNYWDYYQVDLRRKNSQVPLSVLCLYTWTLLTNIRQLALISPAKLATTTEIISNMDKLYKLIDLTKDIKTASSAAQGEEVVVYIEHIVKSFIGLMPLVRHLPPVISKLVELLKTIFKLFHSKVDMSTIHSHEMILECCCELITLEHLASPSSPLFLLKKDIRLDQMPTLFNHPFTPASIRYMHVVLNTMLSSCGPAVGLQSLDKEHKSIIIQFTCSVLPNLIYILCDMDNPSKRVHQQLERTVIVESIVIAKAAIPITILCHFTIKLEYLLRDPSYMINIIKDHNDDDDILSMFPMLLLYFEYGAKTRKVIESILPRLNQHCFDNPITTCVPLSTIERMDTLRIFITHLAKLESSRFNIQTIFKNIVDFVNAEIGISVEEDFIKVVDTLIETILSKVVLNVKFGTALATSLLGTQVIQQRVARLFNVLPIYTVGRNYKSSNLELFALHFSTILIKSDFTLDRTTIDLISNDTTLRRVTLKCICLPIINGQAADDYSTGVLRVIKQIYKHSKAPKQFIKEFSLLIPKITPFLNSITSTTPSALALLKVFYETLSTNYPLVKCDDYYYSTHLPKEIFNMYSHFVQYSIDATRSIMLSASPGHRETSHDSNSDLKMFLQELHQNIDLCIFEGPTGIAVPNCRKLFGGPMISLSSSTSVISPELKERLWKQSLKVLRALYNFGSYGRKLITDQIHSSSMLSLFRKTEYHSQTIKFLQSLGVIGMTYLEYLNIL